MPADPPLLRALRFPPRTPLRISYPPVSGLPPYALSQARRSPPPVASSRGTPTLAGYPGRTCELPARRPDPPPGPSRAATPPPAATPRDAEPSHVPRLLRSSVPASPPAPPPPPPGSKTPPTRRPAATRPLSSAKNCTPCIGGSDSIAATRVPVSLSHTSILACCVPATNRPAGLRTTPRWSVAATIPNGLGPSPNGGAIR